MKILVVGAGGTGGYFGGRLVEAGADVTFLVRPKRAAQLAETGLVVLSGHGDFRGVVKTVTADCLSEDYDLIVLGCKAYDLAGAIEAIAPAITSDTVILPLLNGLRHLEYLDAAAGGGHVLGGLCHIGATLETDGAIRHLNNFHSLTFGARTSESSTRCVVIAELLSPARFDTSLSGDILQDMWEKFVMLATLAGMTCLMRASVGRIAETGDGGTLMLDMLAECAAIATATGRPPRPAFLQRTRAALTERGSSFTASMLRDIERGGRIEADHIIGDMLDRGKTLEIAAPLLRVANCHLQSYAACRASGEEISWRSARSS